MLPGPVTAGLAVTTAANISEYPTQIDNDPNYTITLGDMHGNVMKLV